MKMIFNPSKYIHILISILSIISLFISSPCYSAIDIPRQKYLGADTSYKILRNSKTKMSYRHNWINCINKYQNINTKYPESGWAPAGLYRAAELYLKLFQRSKMQMDKKNAIDLLTRVKRKYPKSAYRYRADKLLKSLKITIATNRTSQDKKIKTKKSVKEGTKPLLAPLVTNGVFHTNAVVTKDTFVTSLRFWSNPEYTRIVVDAQDERDFTYKLLKKDPTINVPFQRLYVDIHNSRLANNFPEHTPIDDDLLKRARAGQHAPHSVRVVVDIKSFKSYKVFCLKDPFRIVLDVWGENAEAKPEVKIASIRKQPDHRITTDNIQSSSIAKQLALGVRKIVIDPGHGGKDPGAPGYLKKIWEKDITLKLAKKLAKKLRDKLKCEVILTRATDKYIALEERTAIANTKKADLFISLHCNASNNKRLIGFETYFLNLATDDQAITVAARENATSKKNISDLESILNDLMQNAKVKESSRLASIVQSSLISNMKKHYSRIKNLGVKQAPFYVLLGARMPAILVETSFISNKAECKRMITDKYQNSICDSITNGVEKYINATNPKSI